MPLPFWRSGGAAGVVVFCAVISGTWSFHRARTRGVAHDSEIVLLLSPAALVLETNPGERFRIRPDLVMLTRLTVRGGPLPEGAAEQE